MLRNIQRAGLWAALAAGAMLAASPAMARDRHRGGDDDAAIAIGAGLAGIVIGAAIASDRDRDYDRYDGYYDAPRYRPRARVYYYDHYDAPRYRGHHYRDRHHRNHHYRGDRRWRGGW